LKAHGLILRRRSRRKIKTLTTALGSWLPEYDDASLAEAGVVR
jgi:hypothetical protein